MDPVRPVRTALLPVAAALGILLGLGVEALLAVGQPTPPQQAQERAEATRSTAASPPGSALRDMDGPLSLPDIADIVDQALRAARLALQAADIEGTVERALADGRIDEHVAQARREVDAARIQAEVARALREVDAARIQADIARALRDLDAATIQRDVERAVRDLDAVRVQGEVTRALRELDVARIQRDLDRALRDIDVAKIQREIREALEEIRQRRE